MRKGPLADERQTPLQTDGDHFGFRAFGFDAGLSVPLALALGAALRDRLRPTAGFVLTAGVASGESAAEIASAVPVVFPAFLPFTGSLVRLHVTGIETVGLLGSLLVIVTTPALGPGFSFAGISVPTTLRTNF